MTARLRIDSNGPQDTRSVISTLVNHEVPGLTMTDPVEGTHRRIVTSGGRSRELLTRFDQAGVTVEALDGNGLGDGIGDLVRHWFDLDCDIEKVDNHLGSHPEFTDQVRRRPGIRITRYPDLWEAAIMIVLGQQISLAAARTFSGRLVVNYGETRGELFRFPEPARIGEEPTGKLRSRLGITAARAKTISDVAGLFADAAATGGGGAPVPLERLEKVPGIGPWTLACLSLRGLTSNDEFPATDAVLRRVLGGVSATAAVGMAADWSPFRSYGTVRLWAEYAGAAGQEAARTLN